MNLILLPWEGSELNPIGHADGMIRYISWNRVLLTNYEDYDKRHFNKMKDELETAGFNVVHLHYSDLPQFKENKVFSLLFDRSWCYINFLQLGTRILIPKLGYDPLDNEALKQIKAAFETTEHEFDIDLIKVDMTSIVENMTENKNSGGALNCLTWTIKA